MMTASAAARDTAATLPQARIAKLPAAFFGAVLGLVGLGLAWRSAVHVFGVPPFIGELILALGAAAFVFLAAFYIAKILRAPAAVLAELMHPGQSSFFGTISISFVLLAAAALPWSGPLADLLWAIGVALQAVLILVVFRNWIVHPMQFDHIHPGWFILMVGIVVGVPPGVALEHHELSWACLAVGILAAVTLYPIILFRLFFHAPLPPALRPTLFILIAPPALIFSAYYSLNGGQLDAFAHGLFFTGLFFYHPGPVAAPPVSWTAVRGVLVGLYVSARCDDQCRPRLSREDRPAGKRGDRRRPAGADLDHRRNCLRGRGWHSSAANSSAADGQGSQIRIDCPEARRDGIRPSLRHERGSDHEGLGNRSLDVQGTPSARLPILPTEMRETARLYLVGKIDQWFFKTNESGVVLIMNLTDPLEAHELP